MLHLCIVLFLKNIVHSIIKENCIGVVYCSFVPVYYIELHISMNKQNISTFKRYEYTLKVFNNSQCYLKVLVLLGYRKQLHI